MKNKISKRSCYKSLCSFILLTCLVNLTYCQLINGFKVTGNFSEQEIVITPGNSVTININASLHFNKKGETFLILFALPNGNSIEWTKGKKIKEGDDWHFDIQHIAAQTRCIRNLDKKNNYIVAYLANEQKSWPAWKRATPGSITLIKGLVDSLTTMFKNLQPKIFLNGHSGGGSFIFGYLDAVENIPVKIERISFLDSDYGYEDSLHTKKLTTWLNNTRKNKLLVLAYNDSIVINNGKPLVSSTGGTWYRSRLMQRKLSESYKFKTNSDTSFITHDALRGRIKFILKENPGGLIYHTVQVEKNGFILSVLSATKFNRKEYFTYFGERVYGEFIID